MKPEFDVVQVGERDGQPRFQVVLVFHDELGRPKESLGAPNVMKILTTYGGITHEEASRRVHHAFDAYRAANPHSEHGLHEDELLLPLSEAESTTPEPSFSSPRQEEDFWQD